MLSPLAPDLWEWNAPLTVAGMRLGHRMTVAKLQDGVTGALWVHSPVEFTPDAAAALGAIGTVQHVIAPNCMHDTYLEGWLAGFPSARFHGAPGMSKIRPDLQFTDTLSDRGPEEWATLFDQHVIRGLPKLNEVAFLHRPSRSLIVADLTFNLGPEMPMLSRVLLRLNDCYCKFGPSRLLKSVIKDRAALRESIQHILTWDFDRIVLSHGNNVTHDGPTRLREAFTFL
jgi:hypothetical protein